MGELMKCAFWGASYTVGAAEGCFPLARQWSLAALSHMHCLEEGEKGGKGTAERPGLFVWGEPPFSAPTSSLCVTQCSLG